MLFQAGGSPAGQDLAAATADAVFARSLPLEQAQAFRSGLRARAARLGRDPDQLAGLPSLRPVVAETDDDARRTAAWLLDSTPDAIVVEDVAHSIGQRLGPDPDAVISLEDEAELAAQISNESGSPNRRLARLVAGERLTPRQLYAEEFWESVVVGTPGAVADHVEEHFTAGAADGFVVQGLHQPAGLEDFVDLVVPELQRRGLTRRAYEETTLRERLGLPRPGRWTAAAGSPA